MPAMNPSEIQSRLRELPGWSYSAQALRREFSFPSFMASMRFVNRIAAAAEEAGHHPDMEIRYNAVTISLSTHSEGGVTGKDFDLAWQIDAIAKTAE